MIRVLINGTDITNKLYIKNVCYKEYARSRTDLLEVNLSNTEKEWEKWDLKIDEEIEVIYANNSTEYSTKTMFIDDLKVIPGGFKIMAKSINLKTKSNTIKIWENIGLNTIFREISSKYNLGFESYETEDFVYLRVEQNEFDFDFLDRLASREGYSIKIFNKKLILFDDKKIESKQSVKTIKRNEVLGEFNVNTKQNKRYSKVIINSELGKIEAENENIVGGTKEFFEEDIYISSQGEGGRFAKNLLHKINQDYQSIVIKIDGDTSISAGNTVNIEGFEKYDGKYFIEENTVLLDSNFFMTLTLRRAL